MPPATRGSRSIADGHDRVPETTIGVDLAYATTIDDPVKDAKRLTDIGGTGLAVDCGEPSSRD